MRSKPTEVASALSPTAPKTPVQPRESSAAREPVRGLAHQFTHRFARHAPFALVFALAIVLLTINVATPWHSTHEDNGLLFESAAINHIRYGLGFTKGQDFFDSSVNPLVMTPTDFHPQGVSDAQEFQYFLTGDTRPYLYGHHPALLGLTVAGSLLLFGFHFWAVRLVPIVFTLLALLLFYRLTTLLFDQRVGAFASALFITFPIAAYYGRDVSHEAPTLCCEVGMALCYVLWRRSGCNGWLVGVAGCVALGGMYGWPMLFFAWILFALDSIVQRRIHWRLALATAGLSALVFGLVMTQIAWVSGWSIETLDAVFLMRTAATPPLVWLKEVLQHNLLDFGLWTWLAALPALLAVWRRIQRDGQREHLTPARLVARWFRAGGLSLRAQVMALFALGGIAHILVFREGAYVHDYWQFYLIPFYAMACGWGGVALARRLAVHPKLRRLLPATASVEERGALLLFTFAVLALAMSTPIIVFLYSTNVIY